MPPTAGRPVVRRAHPGEAERLRALRIEALADAPVAFVERLEDALAAPAHSWVERLARGVEGGDSFLCAAADATGAWGAMAGGFLDDEGEAWLFGVYVTPALRGTGLVDDLVAAVAGWTVGRGCPTLHLEVAETNTRAVRAYRRLGFRPTGAPGRPHPLYPEVTEVVLARSG